MRSRRQIDVQRQIDKLSLLGRKTNEVGQPINRQPIIGSLNTGRNTPSNGGAIDYVEAEVRSTDGIFVFEILVDATLV